MQVEQYLCHVLVPQVNLDEIIRCEMWPSRETNALFPSRACAVIYSGTRAGWWREETEGSLIRAFVNENSQFTNLDAHIHTCVSAHQRRRSRAEEH